MLSTAMAPVIRRSAVGLLLSGMLLIFACNETDSNPPANGANSTGGTNNAGAGGSSATGASSGNSGTAGSETGATGGSATAGNGGSSNGGSSGNSGNAGSSGNSGNSGNSGTSGTGGSIPLIECPVYAEGQSVGLITEPGLVELSGLAAGESNPDVLWAHDDEVPVLWALGVDGSVKARYTLTGDGIHPSGDNEDIAVIPGQTQGSGWLYLGEIGDNQEVRPDISIYRAAEPTVPAEYVDESLPAEYMRVQYPDGPHNAETLLVDPRTQDIFIVQKAASLTATIWYVGPFAASTTVTATAMGSIQTGLLITAGDIARDGTLITVRNYGITAWVWPRQQNETIPEAMANPPCEITLLGETQGEAICFSRDNQSLFTSSEKSSQPDPRPLNQYTRQQ